MLRWLCRGVVLTARRWSQESAACRAAAANKRSAGPRRLTREAGGAGGSRCHGALDGAVLVEQPGGPLALPAGASEALVQNSVFMGSPCASAGCASAECKTDTGDECCGQAGSGIVGDALALQADSAGTTGGFSEIFFKKKQQGR